MIRASTVVASMSIACACSPAARAVAAPSESARSASGSTIRAGEPGTSPATRSVCSAPWAIGVVGGDAQVVVLCPGDVHRERLEPTGAAATALSPALDPARERVCSCAARMPPPAFVDLVITAHTGEGRVTVESKPLDDPTAASDDSSDDRAREDAFAACIGTVSAAATRSDRTSASCPSGGPATFVYPVRLDLTQ